MNKDKFKGYIYVPKIVAAEFSARGLASAILIYCEFASYGAWTGKYSNLRRIFGISERTIQRLVKKLEDEGFIIRESKTFRGNITRNIIVTKYDKNCTERSQQQIQKLLRLGKENLDKYYKRAMERNGVLTESDLPEFIR